MAIEFKKKLALFGETVGVEDAETLLEWLQGKANARVDLSACVHLHPANIQVLLASKAQISAWPKDQVLHAWLQTIFTV